MKVECRNFRNKVEKLKAKSKCWMLKVEYESLNKKTQDLKSKKLNAESWI